MCVMLIQCFGCENLGNRCGACTGRAHFPVPFDAQLALVVACVATALDELGFARIAHIHVPLDAQLALVVECVATALDELASARGDSWSLSHLGYLYPGTTPVMIQLDHNRSCPWV